MASKKTFFNDLWLDPKINPQFAGWLSRGPNSSQAHCNICRKSFDLSNMGRQAVTSHCKGKTHLSLVKIKEDQPSLKTYFCASTSASRENISIASTSEVGVQPSHLESEPMENINKPETMKPTQSVETFCTRDDVTKAEAIWALKVVSSKFSLNSCSDVGETFKLMFPDSSVASRFKMGASKCKYVINYGLAPYFSNELKDKLRQCDDYVVCFDESLNKIAQRGQMDIFVRFFDINRSRVRTEYFNSVFLGRATAQDLLDSFIVGIQPLNQNNILQVSMDGPNVNLSFMKKLQDRMKEDNPDGKKLINIGVCGLHVVNGAIGTGMLAVKWYVNDFLRDAYYILNDSPARRAEYIELTGKTVFPLKHCTTRWLENVPSVDRLLEIFDDVKKFVESRKNLNTKPLKNVSTQLKDIFLKCKLAFFKNISLECVPFLRKFQTSDPLAPFLFSELQIVVRNLLERFVKHEKMPLTVSSLFTLDLQDKKNLRDLKNIDIGFQTKRFLKETKASEADEHKFRLECQTILIKVTEKLLEKCPVKYKTVQGLSSLEPDVIFNQAEQGKLRLNILLESLYSANRITDIVAEKAKSQYNILCSESHNTFVQQFKSYLDCASSSSRLDDFYSSLLIGKLTYKEIWQVIKLVLILAHGNANVESGFSVNKNLLVENLLEQSLVAQRTVDNALRFYETIPKIPITQAMLSNVRAAHRRYEDSLQEAKISQKEEDKKKAEKRKISLEIKKLEEIRKVKKLEALREEEEIKSKITMLEKKKKE